MDVDQTSNSRGADRESTTDSSWRRISIEDADTSLTRKRQRLGDSAGTEKPSKDPGDQEYKAMETTNQAQLTERRDLDGAGRDETSNSHYAFRDPSTTPEASQSTTIPSRSKQITTINLDDDLTDGNEDFKSVKETESNDGETPKTRDIGPESSSLQQPPRRNSLSPSKSPSPEIEVAELELVEPEPDVNYWEPGVVMETNDASMISADSSEDETGQDITIELSQIAYFFQKDPLDFENLQEIDGWLTTFMLKVQQGGSRWYDIFHENTDFWELCLKYAGALFKTRTQLPSHLLPSSDDETRQTNLKLFKSFTAHITDLCRHAIEVDLTALETDDSFEDGPDVISFPYQYLLLIGLLGFVGPEETLWQVLQHYHGVDIEPLSSDVLATLLGPQSQGLETLCEMLHAIYRRFLRSPLLWVPTQPLIWIMTRIMQYLGRQEEDELRTNHLLKDLKTRIPQVIGPLLREIYNEISEGVIKQVPFHRDIMRDVYNLLFPFFQEICTFDQSLAKSFLEEQCGSAEIFEDIGLPELAARAWKMALYKHCIKHGNMSLRVQAIDNFGEDLVEAWQRFGKDSDHPVMGYLGQFVLRNDLVSYLVSPDSHRQLIERAPNIIGFLFITKAFTNRETDIIWNAVLTYTDSTIVVAILNMLKNVLHTADINTLTYFCEKIQRTSLQDLDPLLLDFIAYLFKRIEEKLLEQASTPSTVVYNVCINLINEGSNFQIFDKIDTTQIIRFALSEFEKHLMLGPSEDQQDKIIGDSLESLRQGGVEATGGIYVLGFTIRHILQQGGSIGEIDERCGQNGLAHLAVCEMDTLLLSRRHENLLQEDVKTLLHPRLALLSEIMVHEPAQIDSELRNRFWSGVVFIDETGHDIQEVTWAMLSLAIARSSPGNKFFDDCIETRLPQIQPEQYSMDLLLFVQRAIEYECRAAPLRETLESGPIEIPGIEHLWKLVLTALPGSIEDRAIELLVSLYLELPVLRNAPQASQETTRIAFSTRCIRQVTAAASNITTQEYATPTSGTTLLSEKLIFHRSLSSLQQFLMGVRARNLHKSESRTQSSTPNETMSSLEELKGELLRIKYQAFSLDQSRPQIKEIQIGDLETCCDLETKLSALTHFDRFRVICGGADLALTANPERKIRETNVSSVPFLIVKKIEHSAEVEDIGNSSQLNRVELDVLKHFDHLEALLGMEEEDSAKVWGFLKTFPPPVQLRKRVTSLTADSSAIFPSGLPFRVLLSVNVLQYILDWQLSKGVIDQSFVAHGVRSIVGAITNDQLLHEVKNPRLCFEVSNTLVAALLRFLKERVSADVSKSYIEDALALVQSLLRLVESPYEEDSRTSEDAWILSLNAFSTILEACSHDRSVWEVFKSQTEVPKLLENVMLRDGRIALRKSVGELISNFCTGAFSSSQVSSEEFACHFWNYILAILPQALSHADNCQELFDLALIVFRSLGQTEDSDLDLSALFKDWSGLLFDHSHTEIIGKDAVDPIVFGLANLLYWAVQFSKSMKQSLKSSRDLPADLYSSFLFPNLSKPKDEEVMKAKVPILHTASRKVICDLIVSLAHTDAKSKRLLELVDGVISEGLTEDTPWNFERSKAIRSPAGFVGLVNLTNTCYLNSLIVQLYMNVNFREFLLKAAVNEPQTSQKLLNETQRLFAFMQDSWQAAMEPRNFVSAIRPYDSDSIDICIQMDVEEFYNLLFDRWEAQLIGSDSKKDFRSFFGGQLIQQVKSKECDHISEREEPFSAIQCDIKGRANLEESLRAYVEGDLMEGDNKYSCTSCGRHVDAVKRTCFKYVPDHLIFHLKRFDFNLRSMRRIKINDLFEFPMTIDMSPYNVDTLGGREPAPPPDLFELVGILVHSGTADSGHYYSFIKERPVNGSEQVPSWIQFNDAEVEAWDPANIPGQCFGGVDTFASSATQQFRLPRAYNAYMLFYQRSSSLAKEQQNLALTSSREPVRIPPSNTLQNQIASENELFVRKYCLYDPSHVGFVKNLFGQLHQLNNDSCSEEHEVEDSAMNIIIRHLNQIVARMKDAPEVDNVTNLITKTAVRCAKCGLALIDTVTSNPAILHSLLLESVIPGVRQSFAAMITNVLKFLRDKAPTLHGLDPDSEYVELMKDREGCFQNVLRAMDGAWPVAELCIRSWDDYFGFFASLAELGQSEVAWVMRSGVLRRCLEVLVAEFSPSLRHSYERMLHIASRGKSPSLYKVAELLQILLDKIDLEVTYPIEDEYSRYLEESLDNYSLTVKEAELFRMTLPRGRKLAFFGKLLETNANPEASRQILIKMLRSEPEGGNYAGIYKLLAGCVKVDPASRAGPFLKAVITFCETAYMQSHVNGLVVMIANEVDTIGNDGGIEHLAFFKDLYETENDVVPLSRSHFQVLLITLAENWGPTLLLYPDAVVREEAEALLGRLLFSERSQSGSDSDDEHDTSDPIKEASQQLGHACFTKLNERYIAEKTRVEPSVLEPINRVVDKCERHFNESSIQAYHQERELINKGLKDLLVEEVEDASTGEWECTSDLVSGSSDLEIAPTVVVD